jgi:hypothetical protein
MSNNTDNKIRAFWYQTDRMEKALIIIVIVLWTLFAFGAGLILKDGSERAPIIIEKCSECS